MAGLHTGAGLTPLHSPNAAEPEQQVDTRSRTRRYWGALTASGITFTVASMRSSRNPAVELRAVASQGVLTGAMSARQARTIANALMLAAAAVGVAR